MEVTLLAGLPGSGKTTYLSGMEKQGWLILDDFKIGTDNLKFRTSPKFQGLIEAIRQQRRCVVADIDFCDTNARREAERELRTEAPDLEPRWLFFENDPAACALNIRRRNSESLENELGYLRKYSPSYQIPDEATPLPVYRKDATAGRQAADGDDS